MREITKKELFRVRKTLRDEGRGTKTLAEIQSLNPKELNNSYKLYRDLLRTYMDESDVPVENRAQIEETFKYDMMTSLLTSGKSKFNKDMINYNKVDSLVDNLSITREFALKGIQDSNITFDIVNSIAERATGFKTSKNRRYRDIKYNYLDNESVVSVNRITDLLSDDEIQELGRELSKYGSKGITSSDIYLRIRDNIVDRELGKYTNISTSVDENNRSISSYF